MLHGKSLFLEFTLNTSIARPQTCIMHWILNSLDLCSWTDRTYSEKALNQWLLGTVGPLMCVRYRTDSL